MERRPVTEPEYQVVRWLLTNARTPAGRACETVLATLQVVNRCQCGCVSIDFETSGKEDGEVIADAVAAWPDGSQAGVILWGSKGRLTGLEVYDMTPHAAKYLWFLSPDEHVGRLRPGTAFLLREGRRVVGFGSITRIMNLEQSAASFQASKKPHEPNKAG